MKAFVVIALCIVSTLAKPHYYSHSKPDIRIESYTNAPPAPLPPTTPAPLADPPMHTSYGYQSYHHPAIVVVADEPKPSGHGYQAPPPPPADTPKPMEYGYNHETFVKSSVPTATIVRQFVRTDNAGTYNLDVESSDGSTHVESGSLKNLGHPEGPTSVKEGSYAFTSPEGKRFTVTYTADENGFVARGDHLPTSPPIPEEIQKSLALPRVESSSSDSSPPMHHHHYGYSAPPAFRYDSKSYH